MLAEVEAEVARLGLCEGVVTEVCPFREESQSAEERVPLLDLLRGSLGERRLPLYLDEEGEDGEEEDVDAGGPVLVGQGGDESRFDRHGWQLARGCDNVKVDLGEPSHSQMDGGGTSLFISDAWSMQAVCYAIDWRVGCHLKPRKGRKLAVGSVSSVRPAYHPSMSMPPCTPSPRSAGGAGESKRGHRQH